jgi:hypothetical protein
MKGVQLNNLFAVDTPLIKIESYDILNYNSTKEHPTDIGKVVIDDPIVDAMESIFKSDD